MLVVAAHRLAVGREMSADELALVEHDEGVERSYNSALNYLSSAHAAAESSRPTFGARMLIQAFQRR